MTRTGVRVSAIIIRDNKLLLIHRRKPGKNYWVFPGGAVESTETKEQALVREVKEETNLDVLEFKFSFEVFFDNNSQIPQPFYSCTVSADGKEEIVGEEKYINSADDYYHLEWIVLSDLSTYNILPKEAVSWLTSLENLNL
jgi:mutator protein MutT